MTFGAVGLFQTGDCRALGAVHAAACEKRCGHSFGGVRALVYPLLALTGAPAAIVMALVLMHAVAVATMIFLLSALATREGQD